MKKFISLMLMSIVLLIASPTQAQFGSAKQMAIATGDTVSTSASLDTVSKIITATAGYAALGIQVIGTKVSGTITSKGYLYGSLDGSTYNLTDSSAAFANAAGAQSVWFTKVTTPYVFYKVQVRPPSSATTTEVLAVKVYYTLRRHD